MVSTAPPQLESGGSPFRFDRAELAGAVGDLGVLVPIAVALIVKNGLTPTAVLLPAGLLYVVAGLVYRLPVPVQPLKAFGAIAIAHGFGADDIAAGALLMGMHLSWCLGCRACWIGSRKCSRSRSFGGFSSR